MAVSLDKDKTVAIEADRDLLRRMVVALESDREVDVDTLLQRELSPVPLSIATLDGRLRLASSKSDLGEVSHPSATIRLVPLLMAWQPFSP